MGAGIVSTCFDEKLILSLATMATVRHFGYSGGRRYTHGICGQSAYDAVSSCPSSSSFSCSSCLSYPSSPSCLFCLSGVSHQGSWRSLHLEVRCNHDADNGGVRQLAARAINRTVTSASVFIGQLLETQVHDCSPMLFPSTAASQKSSRNPDSPESSPCTDALVTEPPTMDTGATAVGPSSSRSATAPVTAPIAGIQRG